MELVSVIIPTTNESDSFCSFKYEVILDHYLNSQSDFFLEYHYIYMNFYVVGEEHSSDKMEVGDSSSEANGKKGHSRRGFGEQIKEKKGRFFIVRRCIMMLLCWHEKKL
ncbi:hypothetical protein Leryth_011490 [Lithospermum erythrorhizon]|nr:hypothetical protein Leryth_011490 [Lithospermum erythrorhizon]